MLLLRNKAPAGFLNDIYVRLRGRLQLSYMYAQALREPAAIIATT
jgi:hypothetical protein